MRGVSGKHAEARLESGDLRVVICRSVVHGHTTSFAVKPPVGNLRDTFEGSVAGFEIQIRSPVVRQILAEAAGSAVCNLRGVGPGNGSVEGILLLVSQVSGLYLVNMWRGIH